MRSLLSSLYIRQPSMRPAMIIHALNALCLGFGLGQDRQEQTREDADDGNDDE